MRQKGWVAQIPCLGGFAMYCSIYGSVIPRALPWAVFGAVEGVLIQWSASRYEAMYAFRYWQQGGSWYHPYAFHVYAMLIGFALVMRIQIAYQRFWEGTTQCHLASSKWSDAVMQVMAFDEASKDAFSDEALEFRMLILHYTSLMNACALIDIRRDDDLDCPLTLNHEDPYLFRPNANQAVLFATNSKHATVRNNDFGDGHIMGGANAPPLEADGLVDVSAADGARAAV